MIAGFAICLVLAAIVGGLLWLAAGLCAVSARAEDATYNQYRHPGMGDFKPAANRPHIADMQDRNRVDLSDEALAAQLGDWGKNGWAS